LRGRKGRRGKGVKRGARVSVNRCQSLLSSSDPPSDVLDVLCACFVLCGVVTCLSELFIAESERPAHVLAFLGHADERRAEGAHLAILFKTSRHERQKTQPPNRHERQRYSNASVLVRDVRRDRIL
jgi:hypothetical protein